MYQEQTLVDQVLEQADAALIVDEVKSKLEDEQKRRQEFYENIT